MRLARTADLWWKNAVIYCLDVETFFDSDGDGRGDFRGLCQRVDHLHELGVTCLWLMPFYPTPDRDDGYDITDFYGVDRRLGTHGDLVEFLRLARDRGMRVIVDLVVNHTSDQHPWFRAARSSPDSPYRDFYVWRSEPPPDGPSGVVFPDKEDSLWQYDDEAGEYYLHRFYKHQPDLNVASPAVRDEIARVMGFWLELGVSGFRVDAVPFLLETAGALDAGDLPDPHDYLRDLRAFLSRRAGEAVLLGEVNLPYPDLRRFFGDEDGDELTMCFDFPGMQSLYLALARGDAAPLATALRERPAAPKDGHWATFVRNHDELTLDKLSDDERAEVFAAFGPDPAMQLYGRGLRRRLPSMLGGDQARLRLAYSLLFTLPGTPTLFYGEEIGMAENLAAEGRLAVRTPMQWTDGPGGGFSTAAPNQLAGPVVEGAFGPANVNVATQRDDPESLLSWFTGIIRQYRRCPEFAWGTCVILDCPGSSAAFAHRADLDGQTVVAVHNLGKEPITVHLPLAGADRGTRLATLAGAHQATDDLVTGDDGRVELSLDGYGFCWLRVRPPHPGG
ncbi:alpha-amylase family protein [Frankia sp. CNm7]|uniref:Alpha-amylase family protein n=1 Tax=Frankia nepalensis TaxID=1836974 RepID=A0A937RBJ1_9ACTN|nr:alpha-amylase family protein [Frankia nepalensis]MBL7497090.1 alpha-amylase family protein [Frankia nepalensis]MBL7510762.1 alpha-amylase family protein [Frankia nepalensis]MBL7522480.1 alpha-amylase family protein [Frankia nepalensis]MBL7626772.1 alpha-amylase family protein [Frankia nepalensis]